MKHNELILVGGALEGLRLPTKDEGKAVGEIFISGGALKLGVGAGQTVVNLLSNHLFPFSSITLNNAGATGRYGPTLAQMRTRYEAQDWTQDDRFLNRIGQGIQVFTVPTTGSYTFMVVGGTRGNITSGVGSCSRRRLTVRVTLEKGWKVYVIVGQAGSRGGTINTRTRASAGGGGTFVYCPEYSNQPIVVAGGAGGVTNDSGRDDTNVADLTGQSGRYTNLSGVTTASNLTLGSNASGSRGNGGQVGGGGGFSGNAVTFKASGEALLVAGLLGSLSGSGGLGDDTSPIQGGFGGGGGASFVTDTRYANAGGGGGYTGGNSAVAGYSGGTEAQAFAGHGGNYVNSKAALVSNITLASTALTHGSCAITLETPQT